MKKTPALELRDVSYVAAACRATIRTGEAVEPQNASAYDKPYGNYQALYPALKEIFMQI